jgi:DnaJ-domain-containing protein 1
MQGKIIKFIGQSAILASIVVSTNVLAAESTGQTTLESVIDSQCLREMNESRVWKNSLIMKTKQEQIAIKRTTCKCVNESVMQDASIKAIAQSFNEETQSDLVSKVVLKSLRTCTQKVLDD